MTMLNIVAGVTPGLRDHWSALKAELSLRARRRNAYWQVRRELDPLTDRELSDIGLHRANIPDVAREAADEIRA